jgi:hypothetical protein
MTNHAVWQYVMDIQQLRIGTDLVMPATATVLAVFALNGAPVLFARVDPREPERRRKFRAVEQGEYIQNNERYIGTFSLGDKCWHAFELK